MLCDSSRLSTFDFSPNWSGQPHGWSYYSLCWFLKAHALLYHKLVFWCLYNCISKKLLSFVILCILFSVWKHYSERGVIESLNCQSLKIPVLDKCSDSKHNCEGVLSPRTPLLLVCREPQQMRLLGGGKQATLRVRKPIFMPGNFAGQIHGFGQVLYPLWTNDPYNRPSVM